MIKNQKKMLKALEGSIMKWEKIVAGTGVDAGWTNCPLCAMFYEDDDCNGVCDGCPVSDRVGSIECSETPYEEWIDHFHGIHDGDLDVEDFSIKCPTCKKIAKKELKFLKSLLPKEKL